MDTSRYEKCPDKARFNELFEETANATNCLLYIINTTEDIKSEIKKAYSVLNKKGEQLLNPDSENKYQDILIRGLIKILRTKTSYFSAKEEYNSVYLPLMKKANQVKRDVSPLSWRLLSQKNKDEVWNVYDEMERRNKLHSCDEFNHVQSSYYRVVKACSIENPWEYFLEDRERLFRELKDIVDADKFEKLQPTKKEEEWLRCEEEERKQGETDEKEELHWMRDSVILQRIIDDVNNRYDAEQQELDKEKKKEVSRKNERLRREEERKRKEEEKRLKRDEERNQKEEERKRREEEKRFKREAEVRKKEEERRRREEEDRKQKEEEKRLRREEEERKQKEEEERRRQEEEERKRKEEEERLRQEEEERKQKEEEVRLRQEEEERKREEEEQKQREIEEESRRDVESVSVASSAVSASSWTVFAANPKYVPPVFVQQNKKESETSSADKSAASKSPWSVFTSNPKYAVPQFGIKREESTADVELKQREEEERRRREEEERKQREEEERRRREEEEWKQREEEERWRREEEERKQREEEERLRREEEERIRKEEEERLRREEEERKRKEEEERLRREEEERIRKEEEERLRREEEERKRKEEEERLRREEEERKQREEEERLRREEEERIRKEEEERLRREEDERIRKEEEERLRREEEERKRKEEEERLRREEEERKRKEEEERLRREEEERKRKEEEERLRREEEERKQREEEERLRREEEERKRREKNQQKQRTIELRRQKAELLRRSEEVGDHNEDKETLKFEEEERKRKEEEEQLRREEEERKRKEEEERLRREEEERKRKEEEERLRREEEERKRKEENPEVRENTSSLNEYEQWIIWINHQLSNMENEEKRNEETEEEERIRHEEEERQKKQKTIERKRKVEEYLRREEEERKQKEEKIKKEWLRIEEEERKRREEEEEEEWLRFEDDERKRREEEERVIRDEERRRNYSILNSPYGYIRLGTIKHQQAPEEHFVVNPNLFLEEICNRQKHYPNEDFSLPKIYWYDYSYKSLQELLEEDIFHTRKEIDAAQLWEYEDQWFNTSYNIPPEVSPYIIDNPAEDGLKNNVYNNPRYGYGHRNVVNRIKDNEPKSDDLENYDNGSIISQKSTKRIDDKYVHTLDSKKTKPDNSIRRTNKTGLIIDKTKLRRVQSELDEIQRMLNTSFDEGEEFIPIKETIIENKSEESPVSTENLTDWDLFKIRATKNQLAFLKLMLDSPDNISALKKIAASDGKLFDVFIEDINILANDCTNDNVIEDGYIIDEYRDSVVNLFK